MANQDKQNIVDSVVEAQKKAMDTIIENTKKFSNGNNMVNETFEKGTEWYKNLLENQKNMFSQATNKAEKTTETAKENTSKMNEFYENWFSTQMAWAKQMWDMNQDAAKNFTSNATTAHTNPFAQWQSYMNNMQSQWQNMNAANNWMNQMQNMNPFNQNTNPFNMDSWKKTTDSLTGFFNQYNNILNNSFAEMQKNMQNGTIMDAYKNMTNSGEGFAKFAEMWAPMWKSIQEKTFNMDMYKQWMNPELYKEMMDKYLGFMPEGSREYMQNMTNMMQNSAKQMGQGGMDYYTQMRNMMNNSGMNSTEGFASALNGFNQFQNMISNAAAPFNKMVTPNKYTNAMQAWNEIANQTVVYNIKNAELQYMVYNQGVKVMDQLAENVAKKMQDGTEVNSMLALYQEWLNISDKTYVSLFETDEYSKLMAEVSSLQLKLRKDIDTQMEKALVNIPVATRTEMDEMYKTIYDLKKQVRQLEKMMGDGDEETEEKTAKRTKKA